MKRLAVLFLAGFAAACAPDADPPSHGGSVKIGQAEERIAAGVQLVDVRTREEWQEGHLKGAKLLTSTDPGFAGRAKAALDPAKPVLVYCRSGKRSEKAAVALRSAGFARVDEIQGGILAWKAAGKPVE